MKIDKNKSSSGFRGDIFGCVLVVFAIFTTLSLLSYAPTDPSLNSLGDVKKVQNFCGLFGSFWADLLFQFLGLGAWGIVVAAFYKSAYYLFDLDEVYYGKRSYFLNTIYFLMGLLLLSSIFSLIYPNKLIAQNISAGGVLGSLIVAGLSPYLNYIGLSLVLWSSLIIVCLLSFNKRVMDLYKFLVSSVVFGTFATKKSYGVAKVIAKKVNLSPIKKGVVTKLQWLKPKIVRSKNGPLMLPEQSILDVPYKSLDQRDRANSIGDGSSLGQDSNPQNNLIFKKKGLGFFSNSKQKAHSGAKRRVKAHGKVERKIANWSLPELDMLEDPPVSRYRVDQNEANSKSAILTDKLSQFSVGGEVIGIKPGPAVTMFEFRPRSDVKISKITELADDLSLALSSESVRIIAPIPGRDVVGIETSNQNRETVYLKDILADKTFWSPEIKLPIAMGREADGTTKVVDLRKMPHLLVAGTTGSGKSVFVVSVLTGLLFRHSPKTLRLILIDPKQVDLAAFSKIPHLLMPVIMNPKKAVTALKWAIKEMEVRYKSMAKFQTRGLEDFNKKVENLDEAELAEHEAFNDNLEDQGRMGDKYYYKPQPYIAIVVEEFGDLMAVDKSNVEQSVVRLAQMARACGIHLILAMQSPRRDVVTGLIKTNIPGRISFKVSSKMDSRIILDESGAERLLARGDMLMVSPGTSKSERHHGPWVPESEIEAITQYWAEQGEPQYDEKAMRVLESDQTSLFSDNFSDSSGKEEYDERYDEILDWVSSSKTVSASLLQRKFRLGYPRAARMIEVFEKEGVVGAANGSKPRKVLINSFNDQA